MEAEAQELRQWIFRNRHILRKYSSDQGAYFAKLNGFSEAVIYNVLSTFEDALGGWNTDKRAKACVKHFETTLSLMHPEADLSRLWDNVHRYQTEGIDSEDVDGSQM